MPEMLSVTGLFHGDGEVPHRRLHRAEGVVGGVAAGLAEHLRVDVVLVRGAFVVLAAVQGAGIVLYALFWVVVPQAPGTTPRPRSRRRGTEIAAVAALAVAGFVLSTIVGVWSGQAAMPVVVAALGVALLWRQADEAQRARWAAVPRRVAVGVRAEHGSWAAALRLVGGVALLLVALLGFLARHDALGQVRQGLLFTVVVVAGLALVTAPWWVRLAGELAAERRERIRSQERAELAVRIHDSVLHTLALVQRHADDPAQVQRLARAGERELRSWLYRPAEPAETSLAGAVEALAAEVEDAHGVPIEVVGVGDAPLDDRLHALAAAAREAMVNAAKSSGAPSVSVYYEVEPHAVALYVRDRGRGFDVATVPADRYGVRESIVGRMTRHGGSAVVRTEAGAGTEVELRSPR